MSAPSRLIACHECDMLYRETLLPAGAVARCQRCGAELYRNPKDSLNRALAFTAGAAVLFVLANLHPILALEVGGQLTQATLFTAVRSLDQQDMKIVGALVFVTTILVPGLQMGAMLYVLAPLRFGRVPPGLPTLLRLVQMVRPWGMVEVFMLGVLVAMVKLAHLAHVIPGIALWSFGGVMLAFAGAAAAFHPRDLWDRVRFG
jgi:paraquat-inducible protein A